MKISLREDKNRKIKIVDIEGEVDVYTSMELKKDLNNLIDAGEKRLIINLEKVVYMDSSGLGILVAVLKRIRSEKGNMKLIKLTPGIKKIFELTRLTKFFEIFDTEEVCAKSFE